jgi:hypothetical protein
MLCQMAWALTVEILSRMLASRHLLELPGAIKLLQNRQPRVPTVAHLSCTTVNSILIHLTIVSEPIVLSGMIRSDDLEPKSFR